MRIKTQPSKDYHDTNSNHLFKPHHFSQTKKGARPAEVRALASVFEKSTTELKLKQKLLKCKCTIQIVIYNVRTLNRIRQLPELIASAIDHNVNIICMQEHGYTHCKDIQYHNTGNGWTLATATAWKKPVNITIGDVGMCYVLTFWPCQKCHSRWCTGRKWHIPVAGNRKRLRRRWGVEACLYYW